MMLVLGILLAAALQANGRTYDPNCNAKYKKITSDHTMCIAEADAGVDVPLDQAMKDQIVQFHNKARATVQPPATNMNKLKWDDELALVAGKWARQCKRWGAHDQPYQKMMPGLPFVVLGQNAARYVDNETWSTALASWHNEFKEYKYGSRNPITPGAKIGHYTQMVAATSLRIGCARAFCPNDPRDFRHNFICNYGPWGNIVEKPYRSGERGSACLKTTGTGNGLCDCGDKVCYNRGILNTKSCSCICRGVFTGVKCETVGNCPRQDPWSWCSRVDVARCPMGTRYTCPLRCQVCEAPCNGKQCQNGGVMDWDTCQCTCQAAFSGDTCKSVTCPTKDTYWLCSRFGSTRCYSRINGVVLRYRCPVLCGLCRGLRQWLDHSVD